MKNITLFILYFFFYPLLAQEKLSSANCHIYFEASVPFFEAVEAQNNEVDCVLLPDKGQISFSATIKEFQFKRELMKEHFNSNYLESDRYEKAIFKGYIEKFDMKVITENEQDFLIKGKITIHGQSKMITVNAKIKKISNGISIQSDFSLHTEDFNIEIPNIVVAKISKTVNTKVDCILY